MESELLTIAEYATLKKVHSNTVRGWIKDGRLPAEQLGRSFRIKADAVMSKVVQPVQPTSQPEELTETDKELAEIEKQKHLVIARTELKELQAKESQVTIDPAKIAAMEEWDASQTEREEILIKIAEWEAGADKRNVILQDIAEWETGIEDRAEQLERLEGMEEREDALRVGQSELVEDKKEIAEQKSEVGESLVLLKRKWEMFNESKAKEEGKQNSLVNMVKELKTFVSQWEKAGGGEKKQLAVKLLDYANAILSKFGYMVPVTPATPEPKGKRIVIDFKR